MKTKFNITRCRIYCYLTIPVPDAVLLADLQVPEHAETLVIFAYQFGGSRNHPRTRHVARIMREHGFGSLLCDLLTDEEEYEDEATAVHRNNVGKLAKRLAAVTEWVGNQPGLKELGVALFGAGTGGGAALIVAADMPEKVKAVVSRGGRVDLATKFLSKVACPTLLIVGDLEHDELKHGLKALDKLKCEKDLQVVSGPSHMFGEPGTLETMARQSAGWLMSQLTESSFSNR
jgi:putative phosphoribosyl transferase